MTWLVILLAAVYVIVAAATWFVVKVMERLPHSHRYFWEDDEMTKAMAVVLWPLTVLILAVMLLGDALGKLAQHTADRITKKQRKD